MEFITFKIYPDYPKKFKRFYYKVCIFKRKSSMYKYREVLEAAGANKMRKPYNFEACCSSFHNKKDRYQWGVLSFYLKSAAKSGIVSHELTHATTYFWRDCIAKKHKDIFNNHVADEQYAWILGNLVHQYWLTWYTIKKK